jgi:hypothetical protein
VYGPRPRPRPQPGALPLFGVASLVVVRWAQSFVMLGPFSLLLELAEVQDLRFAKLGELFIQFWHGLWSFPD